MRQCSTRPENPSPKKRASPEAQPDREYAPLTVEIGDEQIIEGMEEGLIGLEAGETETPTIPPEKAYGEPSDENIQGVRNRGAERCSAARRLKRVLP